MEGGEHIDQLILALREAIDSQRQVYGIPVGTKLPPGVAIEISDNSNTVAYAARCGLDKYGEISGPLKAKYLTLIQLGIENYYTPAWMMTAGGPRWGLSAEFAIFHSEIAALASSHGWMGPRAGRDSGLSSALEEPSSPEEGANRLPVTSQTSGTTGILVEPGALRRNGMRPSPSTFVPENLLC